MSTEEKLCQFLEDYLAEELNEKHRHDFESHLPSCGACSEDVKIDRNIDLVLSRVPETVTIPASLDAGFSTRIRKERKRQFYRRGLLAVAVLVLIGFFGILMFDNETPNEPNTEIAKTTEDKTVTSSVAYKIYDPSETVAQISPKKPKETIVVSYPTENKNITMVFLYPVEPEARKPKEDTSLE